MSMLTNWLESLAGEIELTAACLRAESPKSSCAKCIAACPEQALSSSDAGLAIEGALCTNCGACVPACPVQAIHGRSPERTVIGSTLLLDDGPFPVVEELLSFYKKGANTLYFASENVGYPDALQVADSLLAGMGLRRFNVVHSLQTDESNREATQLEGSVQPSSRRQFFHQALRESRIIAAKTLTPAKWRFNHSEFNTAGMFPEASLYKAELDENKCTLCEACFKMCKQNVFTIKNDVLEIHHANCNGCGLCVDICERGAVRVLLKGSQMLHEAHPLTQSECSECGNPFYSWTQNEAASFICPSCEIRKEHGYLNPHCC